MLRAPSLSALLTTLLLTATLAYGSVALAQEAPVGGPPQSTLDTSSLQSAIGRTLAIDQVKGSKVGVHAVDVDTGEVLFSHNADVAFNPASNMKLLTGAAALDELGRSETFVTRLGAAKAPGKGGVVDGDLYVVATGDPLILYEDLLSWASDLKAQGVTKITGDLVIDDTAFGEGFIPPGYDQKDEDAAYRAPIGALSVNFNSVTAIVEPGAAGQPATVRLQPPNAHVEVADSVRTVGGKGQSVRAQSVTMAGGDGTKLVLSGAIGADAAPVYIRKRIDNPSLYTGSVLEGALELVGIEVTGEVKRGQAPEGLVTLVRHESKPLSYIVMLMNKWSNNFMAEMLFRQLGRPADDASGPATSEAAREGITAFMADAGVDTEKLAVFNGSGLYDGNQITPRQIAGLLTHMADHPAYPEFAASLAIAGTDGTLRSRLGEEPTEGNLRGKTGTLNEVTALGGYLTTAGGRQVAYVILFNDTPVRAWRLRGAQDAIARAIAAFEE